MSTTDEEQALDYLRTVARNATARTAEAAALKAERDALVLDVRERFGCQYVTLAEATGLSRDRITQILRARREASHPATK